jgi:hypothetical protein
MENKGGKIKTTSFIVICKNLKKCIDYFILFCRAEQFSFTGAITPSRKDLVYTFIAIYLQSRSRRYRYKLPRNFSLAILEVTPMIASQWNYRNI